MSTEKMREEFEEWVWNRYREVYWYDLERAHVLKHYKNGYQTEFLNVRWHSWQASRAAIEVELPPIGDYIDRYGQGNNCDEYVDMVKDAIESLGLKVKPC